MPDVTGATLRKAIAEQVDLAATTLHTDSSATYQRRRQRGGRARAVDHSADEYVRYGDGSSSRNAAENYF